MIENALLKSMAAGTSNGSRIGGNVPMNYARLQRE
jgi:hypothetical protein